ncbi:hypothetical protein NOG67_13365 [Erwinia persicina]|uniref:hypothetical protein n=1 Tax=Erwinia persicina TaxID=55211 RepID=UPI000786F64E|nr:hypothetical protein [Erwinia persicina]MCQ4105173.1 hypothetical protein [Erwinia persicina]UTX11386.1 hypothetical protein NOG67_13365 [Erwinia persicina]
MNVLLHASLPYVALFSIFGGAITFTWTVIIFILNRSREREKAEFERLHNVIRKIQVDESLDKDGKNVSPYIEIQIAAIYELRYLTRYYPFSALYLEEKKQEWKTRPVNAKYKILGVPAIDLALETINRGTLTQRLKRNFIKFYYDK